MNFTSVARSHSVSDLLNVTVLLGEELGKIGIHTAEDLRSATSFGAWQQLYRAGMRHDTRVLFALEGAIQGVPWQSLTAMQRHKLLELARTVTG